MAGACRYPRPFCQSAGGFDHEGRASRPVISVFTESKTKDNPYKKGDSDHLVGLYCETVLMKNKKLIVPNALKDERWKNNPDIKLGMVSYLGYPLRWPDKKLFGTLCILTQNF